MAHGWNSYFPNFPPRSSDPRSLRRTESGRPLSQHIGNFIGHHDFSGTGGSREVPVPNTNFNANYCRNNNFETPRSDCAYNRFYERHWQADRHQMGRDYPQRCRSRDFPNYASHQYPSSGSYHSSFAPDFHHSKQDRDMRNTSYRGNYSSINNCFDTDAREARPSCKFTQNNFFPRPKTDIVSNESSTKYIFSPTGNRNSQNERLCPNMSEKSSFSVKGYREHNHSSVTSSNVRTKGNEYDGNDDAFQHQKQKVDMDRDLPEAAYSDFHMTEKCSGDGKRQLLVDKEDELLKSTDDQDTVVNDNKLEKSQALESIWEKSGSLDEELFDEKTSLIPISSNCENEIMETDQHERGSKQDTSHPLVLNESSSSDDNDDEQSESISSSNNPDFEFSLQLPESQSCESLGGVSDDHSCDCNADTNISQEKQQDEELSSSAVEETSTFSPDVDYCRPGDTRDHSSEDMTDHEKKCVASDVLLISSHRSGINEYLRTDKGVTNTAKSKMPSQVPDCIGPTTINDSILKNSEQDFIHVTSSLQPLSLGIDIDPTVEMEKEGPPVKTTPILSQDGCTPNVTEGCFSDYLGDENHKCVEDHPESPLKQDDSGTNLQTVHKTESPPIKIAPNFQSQDYCPTVTSDNISIDTNDIVRNSEFPLKQNTSGTDYHTDQEMRNPLDKEAPHLLSSPESSPRPTNDTASNDNGDIINCSEPLHPNALNTEVLLYHSEECANPVENANATSHTDPKCITRALKTESNTQRDFSDLKSCLQPGAATDVSSLSEEQLISQEENTNSAFFPDPHHSINESFTIQEQTEHGVDFPEDAKDSFEKLNLSLSEPGLLYGEPLSGDESSCGDVETSDMSYQLQETPGTRPEKDPVDEPPAPQLTSSVRTRPFMHPVVVLMNMESADKMSSTYNCANCLHADNSVDSLIKHHYCCHPMPSYDFCKKCNVYLMKNEQDKKHLCGQIISQRKKNCGPYKCNRCGLIFSKILAYVRHMRDHTGRTPYRCSGCGVYFSQSGALNHHRKVPGRCKQSLSAKKTDPVIVKSKRPTPKDQAQNTSYKSMTQCYVRLLDISKTNVCHFCGKSFPTKKKTKKHIYNVHKRKNVAALYTDETSSLYKCPLCPRLFKYSYNRARHLRFCVRNAIYGGKKKVGDKYICPLCQAAFTATSNRYRHIKLTCLRETLNRLAREKLRLRQTSGMENEPKPSSKESVRIPQEKGGEEKKQASQGSPAPTIQYKCSHCPAIFFHPSGKYRHMKKHELFKHTGKIIRYRKSIAPKPDSPENTITEESTSQPEIANDCPKPTLSCRFCGLCFHVLATLKRHERNHHGERPYRCLECRKGFKKLTHLIGHRVVHQKRIQCTVCKKILPTIGDLIQHRSSHPKTKKGMLQCPECPAQFQYPVYLLRHLQSHKNKNIQKSEGETSIKQQQSTESVKEKESPKLLQCSLCRETFDDAQILRKHSLTHISRSSTNQCPFCKNKFTSRHSLIRHMVKHTGDKPFSCANCGRQFYRSIYLKIHSETCTPSKLSPPVEESTSNLMKKRYCCSICPRRFWKRIRLEMHLIAHKKKSLIQCTKCSQYYGVNMISRHKLVCITKEISSTDKSTNSFESNSAQVSQKGQQTLSNSNTNKLFKLKCSYCPKRFRYRSLLLRHSVTHTGVQPFRCMHCNQRFKTQTLCISHEAFCDGGSKTAQPKLKNTETDMESEKFPAEGEVELKCKFCTKTFVKARNLRHHILTHNEVKPYRCKACDSCFSRYDHLKVHQALCKSKKTRLEVRIPKISLEDIGKGWQSKLYLKPLDEEESFDCKVCLKSFPTENRLSRHNTMFHTVKKFKCSRCGSAFSHEKTLKQHRRVKRCKKPKSESYTPLQESNQPTENIAKQLDGIRKKILVKIQPLFNKDLKFVCSYCPRAFKKSWQLNVHTRLHTGERPYSCKHCGEKFIRSDYLVRHYSKCKEVTQPSNALCDRCGGFFSEKQLENHKKTCILRSCSPTISKSTQPSPQGAPKGFSCAYCSSRFLLFSQLQEHFLSTHKLETEAPPMSTAPLQQLLSNIPKIKEEPVDESYGKASSNGAGMLSKPEKALSDTSNQFVCQKCNMCFTNRAGLTGHQRAHATHTPYICKYCSRGFWNKTQHRNHYRKCRIVTQRLDIPVKAEINCAFDGSKSKDDFKTASTTTSAKGLPTNVLCKEEPEEESTQSSYGNQDYSSDSSTQKKTVQYQCSECDKSFTDGLLLISHLEDHGREEQEKKTNKCSKCGRRFSNQGNLRRHLKLHMAHQRYFCSLCTKVFTTISELEKHKASHDGNKPFSCKLCEQRFLTRLALCEHYSGEHADEIFHCQCCNKVYASKRSLFRHYKKWHPKEMRDIRSANLQRGNADQQSSSHLSTNGDSDEDQNLGSDSDSDSAPYFPCHVCGKTFPTSESLEDHQLCHLGKKPHECAECGKCFFQASQLQQHQRMHKSEFQCQTCGRGFVTLFALRNHKHSHGKSRPFRCSKCHLGFARPTQLAEHMSTHREESFPCDICNKIFQCKSSRAEHRKTHSMLSEGVPTSVSKGELEQPKSAYGYTTEFRYRCGICNERFRDPEELSEHGCLEAIERPYACTECNKHFLHASHLKKHRNTHQQSWSDREYLCNQCNSNFSSPQHFLSHLKTHVGTATGVDQEQDSSDGFICPICHQCFASATELISHFPVHPDCAPERKKAECDTSEGELEEQELLHPTAPAEYECAQCRGIFLGKEALCHHRCSLQHQKAVENTNSDPTDASPAHEPAWDEEEVDVTGEDLYKCHECSMQFSSKSILLEHQNNQHPNNWKEFKCETCGKTFAKKRYLRKHELRQHGPKEHATTTADLGKKFKCVQCRARFYTAQDLSNHMRLHAEKQAGDYRCDMCYKSFSKRALLKQHQESHVGEVVYECTECDKAFAFPHLLEEHQRSHAASSD
ncbi:zinc finger protein 1035 isoform 1-T2 [Anableps anableps]